MNPPISEIVRRLNAAVGPTLVSALSGASDTKAPREWAKYDGPQPPAEAVKRIAFAYKLWRKVAEVEGEQVARVWFIGGNPWLDDDPAIYAIREDRLEQVSYVVKALIDETWYG